MTVLAICASSGNLMHVFTSIPFFAYLLNDLLSGRLYFCDVLMTVAVYSAKGIMYCSGLRIAKGEEVKVRMYVILHQRIDDNAPMSGLHPALYSSQYMHDAIMHNSRTLAFYFETSLYLFSARHMRTSFR